MLKKYTTKSAKQTQKLGESLAKEILHYEPAVEFQSGISEVISAIVKKPEAELRKK